MRRECFFLSLLSVNKSLAQWLERQYRSLGAFFRFMVWRCLLWQTVVFGSQKNIVPVSNHTHSPSDDGVHAHFEIVGKWNSRFSLFLPRLANCKPSILVSEMIFISSPFDAFVCQTHCRLIETNKINDTIYLGCFSKIDSQRKKARTIELERQLYFERCLISKKKGNEKKLMSQTSIPNRIWLAYILIRGKIGQMENIFLAPKERAVDFVYAVRER